jgi:sec-independent protein translocase protein TatB
VFGVGLPEMAVIAVIAVIVFGPDRLPEFARQAGRMLRQLRNFSNAARDDIRKELGPEFADFELADLDPRRAVRKYMSDVMDDDPGETVPVERGRRPLERGERTPYD